MAIYSSIDVLEELGLFSCFVFSIYNLWIMLNNIINKMLNNS